MAPRPPTSPLSPYTTLFRSPPFIGAPNVGRALEALDLLRFNGVPVAALSLIDAAAGFANAAGIDRKSTRLNSSHRCISYAVFCLKKKKLARFITRTRPNANA